DLMLGVEREVIAPHRSAARADRKPVDVLLLCEVRRNPDCIAARRTAWTPDRQPADFLRRRYIAVQQCRGEISDGHIVKAVTGLVARQQRGDIKVDRK